MQEEDLEEEKAEAGAEDGAGDGREGAGAAAGPKAKKGKWFDAKLASTKTERAWTLKATTVKEEAARVIAEVNAAVDDFNRSVEEKTAYKRELLILANRAEAMQLVAASGETASAELLEYINKFDEEADKQSVHSGDRVAKAGPCEDFRMLITADGVGEFVASYNWEAIESEAHLKLEGDAFKAKCAVVEQLFKSCRAAVRDIYSARLAARKKMDKDTQAIFSELWAFVLDR
jgi:hypothetical protein